MAVFIDNIHDLLEDIDKYQRMFPDTYTNLDGIQERLEREEFSPPGMILGIEVSSEWQEKCYGFELDRQCPPNTIFRYVGIWKC